jgi:hypothetical protein
VSNPSFPACAVEHIGGGVLNFGQIFGPVAVGILMALWAGLLIRWLEQRQSLLRLMLFMLGTALTFNLGRDISLLVLWPIIFACFFVPVTEVWAMRRFGQLGGGCRAFGAKHSPESFSKVTPGEFAS